MDTSRSSRAQGSAAEEHAAALVASSGARIVARNWSCRRGELDIVALDGTTLAFVEVRSRSSAAYGGAAASVGTRKQQRLIAAARAFLSQHAEYRKLAARFDVIAIDGSSPPRWLRSAFTSDA
ncbi:MAG TPA: YraN family protein [Nevskiaceae bacterium]|nr:YraN family protein [Nevskiaceae bacterium]